MLKVKKLIKCFKSDMVLYYCHLKLWAWHTSSGVTAIKLFRRNFVHVIIKKTWPFRLRTLFPVHTVLWLHDFGEKSLKILIKWFRHQQFITMLKSNSDQIATWLITWKKLSVIFNISLILLEYVYFLF